MHEKDGNERHRWKHQCSRDITWPLFQFFKQRRTNGSFKSLASLKLMNLSIEALPFLLPWLRECLQVQEIRNNPKSFALSCYTRFFHKQRFFSTRSQCCLTFLWIELQMLLRCCFIQVSIIIPRHFWYLLYLRLCLDLPLFCQVLRFMSYICDLFFVFIFFSLRLIV